MKFFTTPHVIAIFSMCCIFWSTSLNAQSQLSTQAVEVTGGYSTHGTGDLLGIAYGVKYRNYLSRRLSWDIDLRSTIHNGKDEYFYTLPGSNVIRDGSIRFTTAGVQLGFNGGLSIIRDKHNELMINLGGFGRYQSASNGSDGYSVLTNFSPAQPGTYIQYNNTTRQKTLSAGYQVQAQYNFTFTKKIYTGVSAAFQNDTQGDVITSLMLSVGKRF